MSIDHSAAPRILTVFLILLARSVASVIDLGLTGVPTANPKTPGLSTPNVLSPELIQTIVAQGSTPLENATGVYGFYGYCADGPILPLPGSIQAPGMNVEATKTEPDKNTYLILRGQQGPDPEYGYGTHFLFQGHENSVTDPVTKLKQGYLSRINLDADGA